MQRVNVYEVGYLFTVNVFFSTFSFYKSGLFTVPMTFVFLVFSITSYFIMA